MERLTWKRSLDGYEDVGLRNGVTTGDAIVQLADYEDTGLIPDDITDLMAAHGTAILEISEYRQIGAKNHLLALAQAEKDGRLVVLPCSLHQPLYTLKNGEIHRNYGCQWHFTDKESQTFGTLSLYGEFVSLDDFGKTVFLSHEEAEAALKKRDETDDEP